MATFIPEDASLPTENVPVPSDFSCLSRLVGAANHTRVAVVRGEDGSRWYYDLDARSGGAKNNQRASRWLTDRLRYLRRKPGSCPVPILGPVLYLSPAEEVPV